MGFFENTWVGCPLHRPLYSPSMWNAREATEIDLPRTTNNLESWHLQIQTAISCHHPTFFKIAEQLIKENLRVHAFAVKLINGANVPLYKDPRYRDANNNLFNLILRYNDPNYPIDRYLRACSHYVMQLE